MLRRVPGDGGWPSGSDAQVPPPLPGLLLGSCSRLQLPATHRGDLGEALALLQPHLEVMAGIWGMNQGMGAFSLSQKTKTKTKTSDLIGGSSWWVCVL